MRALGEHIYHLVWEADWLAQACDGVYRPESLALEGFIHCTREPEMLIQVANQFFKEVLDDRLLCLKIDVDLLSKPVRYEDPGIGHLFPHVYGGIERAAVVGISEMRFSQDGWELPHDVP